MFSDYIYIEGEIRYINTIKYDFAYQRKKINGKIRVKQYNLRDLKNGSTTDHDIEFDTVEEAKAWVANLQHCMTHN